MIQVGILSNARAAQALVDYLKSQGIVCRTESLERGTALYVANDNDLASAVEELEYFVAHPFDKKYLKASWDYGSTNNILKDEYGHPTSQLIAKFLSDSGPLTLAVFFSSLAIFLFWNLGYANEIFTYLGFFEAVPNASLNQIWRVFTPILLHFSLLHLIFNLLWWWYLGGRIEKRVGFGALFILLLAGSSLPNILQFMITGPNFGGLSGVVYALAGYSWVMGIRKPQTDIGLPPALMGFMLLWLILGFFNVLGLSMANGAHLGGLMVGLLQGWFDSRKK